MPIKGLRGDALGLSIILLWNLSPQAWGSQRPEAHESAKVAREAPLLLAPKGVLSAYFNTQPEQGSQRSFAWSLSPWRVFGLHSDPILIHLPFIQEGRLEVERDGQQVFETTLHQTTQVMVPPLALPTGVQHWRFRVIHAGGAYASESIPILSLGIPPPDHSYIVVDKEQFSLFWVRYGVLQNIYPIATGRPRTPTLAGLWLLGQKEVMTPPTTDWGARRLKIYREDQYQSHWSGYAIHGTNRPTSIGTEASHGCVRMFNDDVIALFEAVPVGTPVQIVDKLPLSEAAYQALEALEHQR